MIVCRQIVLVCWLVFFVTWAILATAQRGNGRGRYSSAAAVGIRLLIFVAVLLAVRDVDLAAFQPFGGSDVFAAAVGAALCVAGLAFAIWARVALGRNWGMPMTVHENPDLVTSGPYRFVRHPIYTGMAAMFVGASLVYPIAALPCAVAIAYSVISAFREERDMENRFLNTYREYKKSTKMLVPFVI